MGAVVSSSHAVIATPSSPGGGLFTPFPCSSLGPSCGRQSCTDSSSQSFLQDAVLHKLLQLGTLPQGAILQEQAAPQWGPHRFTGPSSKCSSTVFPWGHSSFRIPVLLWDPPWLQVDPPCSSMGFRGTATSPGAAPGAAGESQLLALEQLPPSASLTWVSAGMFLKHSAVHLCQTPEIHVLEEGGESSSGNSSTTGLPTMLDFLFMPRIVEEILEV